MNGIFKVVQARTMSSYNSEVDLVMEMREVCLVPISALGRRVPRTTVMFLKPYILDQNFELKKNSYFTNSYIQVLNTNLSNNYEQDLYFI